MKRIFKSVITAMLLFSLLCSCSPDDILDRFFMRGEYVSVKSDAGCDTVPGDEGTPPISEPEISAYEAVAAVKSFIEEHENDIPGWIDGGFVDFIFSRCGNGEMNERLFVMSEHGETSTEDFLSLLAECTHLSLNSMQLLYTEPESVRFISDASGKGTVIFAGDICLDDDWENMVLYYEREKRLEECVSPSLLAEMREADLTVVNNEFCYSERGEINEDKYYNFRAKPENTAILGEMGVDCVSLGNNHVWDYGEDAFYDTLEALKKAGIDYVGAGKNLAEAMEAKYYIIGGETIALCAASRAEKMLFTQGANAKTPGVLLTYNPKNFIAAINTASQKSDYVIAIPHWGTENTVELEEVQISQGRQYLEAGASAVIGGHTHCLQGFEFAGDNLIAYSMGNFWFNHDPGETMLLKCHVTHDGLDFEVIPCTQDRALTSDARGEEKGSEILAFLGEISVNAEVTSDGKIIKK